MSNQLKKDISEATDEELKELASEFVKNFKKHDPSKPLDSSNLKQQQQQNQQTAWTLLSLTSWRMIYMIFASLLRYIFALQTSYIHPDEFFQSFQPLYNDNIPWEFRDGCRSMAPLYLIYFPVIWIGELLNLKPHIIYYLTKLEFCFLSWLVLDFCVFRIMPVKQERIKALFFMNTSYITLVYQSHTFSNSLETILLITVVWIINDLRDHMSAQVGKFSKMKLFLLAFCISFGIFNRVTFLVWLVLPSYFLLKFFLKFPLQAVLPAISFTLTTIICILIDTYHFKGELTFPSSVDSIFEIPKVFVIAPLNNILYNTQISNLSKHGLHPLYTHVLINYPQILGPLIFLFFPFQRKYFTTTPFLSLLSGITTLSMIPHQELRFLIPVVPLASCCVTIPRASWSKYVIQGWFVFNVIMLLVMGILHQGGIVSAMEYLQNAKTVRDHSILLFWRTYKPPTFMVLDDRSSTHPIYLNRDEDDLLHFDYGSAFGSGVDDDYIIDFMGMDFEDFKVIVSDVLKNSNGRTVKLVTPLNAVLNFDNCVNFKYDELWNSYWHYDMDHFEYDEFGLQTFKPGIGIYQLI